MMVIFLSILAIILLLAAVILFLPVPIVIRLVNKEVSVRLFKLPFIKRKSTGEKGKSEVPSPPPAKKKLERLDEIKGRISACRKLYKDTKPQLKELLARLFKVAEVVYYRGVVTMGFDDPMNTGMAVGVAGAFLTELNAFFYGLLRPSKQSYMSAVPNFNEKGLNFVAEAKLQISVFKALLFLKAVKAYQNKNQEALNIIFGGNEK